jgi:hypothetical protein
MSKTRFLQILFSLVVIAALTLAIASAPVYALSSSPAHAPTSGNVVNQVSAPVLPPSILICRIVVVRHDGHIIKVWRCHKIVAPS